MTDNDLMYFSMRYAQAIPNGKPRFQQACKICWDCALADQALPSAIERESGALLPHLFLKNSFLVRDPGCSELRSPRPARVCVVLQLHQQFLISACKA